MFLLLFPSLAFAIDGCPVGVQLGNVTMATSLPVCLKFEASKLGGCLVDCKGVCVELPLANTKGPVETTGGSCSWSDSNGSGSGDADGSGNTPGEGPSGTKPIDGWFNFEPVIGDATGTSVSGAVAKLNKNLGVALRQVVDGTKQDSNNINSIAHSAESFSRDMKTALYQLDKIATDTFQTQNTTSHMLGRLNTSNEYLQSINSKLDNLSSGSSGSGSSGTSPFTDDMARALVQNSYGINSNTTSIHNDLSPLSGQLSGIMSMQGEVIRSINGVGGNISSALNGLSNNRPWGGREFSMLMDKFDGLGNGSGEGGGIDYSKMPGSAQNPLHVAGAEYNSGLCKGGAECFFDLATVNNKYKETKDQLTSAYGGVKTEMADIFRYNFSGAAGVPKCFDMFSMFGHSYSICPDAGGYWEMLAAILMFIFYFIALMIVAKR
ncbi:hypothetical protein [Aeromonas hydrophila]|uniref:hypothetical protein n=1 Tax=Aeromonas hydrophila TaxID=644 RepID=UPI0013032616|nr:hypothetical protein [Aeromonas hydrophila]QGZ72975.1 hypothetical protein GQR50_10835 [Aeromonas hydrophila]QGZ72984.1 hypothetical protein GQR50_10880 [Aeromonas hydrophila]